MNNSTATRFVIGTVLVLMSRCPLPASDLATVPDAVREAIDGRVVNLPDRRTEKPDQAFYGTLADWGIARTPLKPEEERELAKAEHQTILKTQKTSQAPEKASRVLKQLAKHLPAAASREFEYLLTIIETEDFRSWTTGGGYLYLSRPMYDALTRQEDHAADRLAFALAHEMGHVVRQHCRRGYQLIKLQDFAKREGMKGAKVTKLKKAVRRVVDLTGDVLRFLYEPAQEYQADSFASHLCENAGFDVQAGWDVLRQGVVTEDQGGNLAEDPAHALISNERSAGEKQHPSASERLQQLCLDRDGVIHGDQYGLWEFDRDTGQWIKPRLLRVAARDRIVLMVHGMDSSLSGCYLDLARALADDRSFREHRLLGLQYPGDVGLARAGMFLHRELSESLDANVKPDFVCHSAGGLVVRFHCELKGGAHRQIILQGTPNHGSDWATLRPVVEMKQFVGDLQEGYSQAIENAILDG